VNAVMPEAVGFPLITPPADRFNPVGSAPAEIRQA
jgi:hypothetical protein